MSTDASERCRLILVGAATPLGAELRKRLGEARLPIDEAVVAEFEPEDEEGGRRVSEFAGEPLLVVPVEEVEFAPGDVVVLCDEPLRSRSLLGRASAVRLCVDASGASRGTGVPWVHARLETAQAPEEARLVAVPQPVSATLASLLEPLVRGRLLRAAHATVLLPASSLGDRAAEELYQQTLGLLSFSELPRERLAHQLAFNILPWEDPARPGAATLASDLVEEVGRLLGDKAPECDLQLLLAPTFRGYGYSLRLLTRPGTGEEEIAERFRAAGLHVAREGGAPASPVEALQQGEQVLISRLHQVSQEAVWIWAVADSLGADAAENVVQVVRGKLGGRVA